MSLTQEECMFPLPLHKIAKATERIIRYSLLRLSTHKRKNACRLMLPACCYHVPFERSLKFCRRSDGFATAELPPRSSLLPKRMRQLAVCIFIMAENKPAVGVSEGDQKDGNKETAEERSVSSTCGSHCEGCAAPSRNEQRSKKSAKKKKKGKKAECAVSGENEASGATAAENASASVNVQTLRQIQKAMEQLMATDKPARTPSEAKQRKYEFWDTQPVPKIGRPRPCFRPPSISVQCNFICQIQFLKKCKNQPKLAFHITKEKQL